MGSKLNECWLYADVMVKVVIRHGIKGNNLQQVEERCALTMEFCDLAAKKAAILEL